MIIFKKGNLLNKNTEAIVNTVNCVGVMGKGIALQFKKKWPENFNEYLNACNKGLVSPGKMFLVSTGMFSNPKYIINFPTKRHWKGKSKIEDIENGLIDLIKVINKYEIKSISLPPLGCGLGGLDWTEVKPLILEKLQVLNHVEIYIFEPGKVSDSELNFKNKLRPNITPGRAALINLVYNYFNACLDPMISLLEVHKLMYFLQESGEDLKLKYSKAQYGPYNLNLRHVLSTMEGHYTSGYAGEDKPNQILELIPGAIEEANDFLKNQESTLKNTERVLKLVDGFETSFGLELLSTVHWVVKHENATSLEEVIEKIYNWNSRKKDIFSKKQIATAYEKLIMHGWA